MLQAPLLDDRKFQDLVDDAKRLVQRRCPDWTDHNVSDPGITLIEAFAQMVDQLIYRLNRVPDLHYVKFLELLGDKLLPPTAAETDITFWLSAPQDSIVSIPAGTQASTIRTENQDAIIFTTPDHLDILPCKFMASGTDPATGKGAATTETLTFEKGFECFSRVPTPGDSVLIGLSNAVPSCVVSIDVGCDIEGHGVDPDDPPIVWSAWNGYEWHDCDLESDSSGGLNRDGEVVLHVPPSHRDARLLGQKGGWLRAAVVESGVDRPGYTHSPRIYKLECQTVGGTSEAVHAEIVTDELFDKTEGVPGEWIELEHRPLVRTTADLVVEVAGDDGYVEWKEVDSFEVRDPSARRFVVDYSGGRLMFPPAVRRPDGGLDYLGDVLPPRATARIKEYAYGGGKDGNVAARSITVLRTSIPFVSRVDNRSCAIGGADPESVEQARDRGPLIVRTRDRAVTRADYEMLVREVAPEIGRVRCIEDGVPGGVRVLVVPDIPKGQFDFELLVPSPSTLERIAGHLEPRRCLGSRISVEPPLYLGITVVATIRASDGFSPVAARDAAIRALNTYFHPVSGGPKHKGWPFGRDIHVGDIFAVLQAIDACNIVESAELHQSDPVTGERHDAAQRLDLDPNTLLYGFGHRIDLITDDDG